MNKAVVVAVSTALLSSCVKSTLPGPKIDPALVMLIPPDTQTLAGLRLEELEKTDTYKKYFAQRQIPQIDAFAESTGVDPRKDLWELLFISNGKKSAVVGHGKFSDEAEPKLQKQGDKRFSYKGFNFVGDDSYAILLMSPSVVATGETEQLKAMVDAREKGAPPPAAIAALIKDMPTTSHLWIAYNGGPIKSPFALPGNLENLNRIGQSVQSMSFYMDFSVGASGLGVVNCTSEQDAQQVEAAVKAGIGLGRLSTSTKQPELQRVFDGLRVTEQERQVKLYVEEPPELLNKALDLAIGRAGSPAPLIPRQ